jgi:hypothetical protein
MKQLLKKATKDYFERPQLNEDKLAEFEQLLATVPSSNQRRRWRPISVCAVVLLLALGFILILPSSDVGIQQQIANEVAKNHIKMKPLEVTASTVRELRPFFRELDFVVTPSNYFSARHHTLLGARYCTIQGNTAAQLRFRNSQGEKVTLYEVDYDPGRYGRLPSIEKGESPVTLILKGVQVNIWREKGLLMASVTELH